MPNIYKVKGKEGLWRIIEKSSKGYTMRINNGNCVCTCKKEELEEIRYP